jgi:RNA polymerase sigma-70 factor (ECF subfamily)
MGDESVGRDYSADAQFRTTRWSLVLSVARDTAESRAALETLCRLYRPPIYAYVRGKGYAPADAEDLVQGFFASVLQGRTVERADRGRGRFRAYMLGALKRFMAGQLQRAHALKRGGGVRPLSLDAGSSGGSDAIDPAAGRSPEDTFDREWALRILDLALAELRTEFGETKRDLFDALVGSLGDADGEPSYRELGERLGMTEGNVKVAIHRMRRRYRESVRQQIMNTVDSPSEVDDEIRHLFTALRR